MQFSEECTDKSEAYLAVQVIIVFDRTVKRGKCPVKIVVRKIVASLPVSQTQKQSQGYHQDLVHKIMLVAYKAYQRKDKQHKKNENIHL